MDTVIKEIRAEDRRFDLLDGAGSDAVHKDPQYGYGVTRLISSDSQCSGTGIAYTLGGGTDLVSSAIKLLSEPLIGKEIEELMSEFGAFQRSIAEHHQIRWLGPHKGVIHLALASITNACFDLWAKSRGVPLWKLLLDLKPKEVIGLIDFSYLEEVLTADEALAILKEKLPTRKDREGLLNEGYPGYDTSVGWFAYSDERIMENARKAMDKGFTAMKLKVGSPEPERDIRRATLGREAVGDSAKIMVDANQAWSLPKALKVCEQ
ncbi:MAG: mandelate racemase, partial [Verrucomicrobiales bacterium]|nr:mandelate racemase [Verrucomicrobiales bacterium]